MLFEARSKVAPQGRKAARRKAAEPTAPATTDLVHRFGHDGLRDETAARTLLEAFLPRLFRHHEVTGRH
ncbi:hypothetical protein [Streptomyces sp. NPDC093094]|uniref:hypothetical protein n=1 Tax=Streptomyces sp. NPDC093094 TaxID=3366026 RepID=UPI00380549C8